jgi:TPR repeat protein
MASGDLGSALAVGAFGLAKDVAEAERYLRMGAGGGDVSSRRNLGLLLLEQGRLAEAMEQLGAAAQAGDTQAAATLQQVSQEAGVIDDEPCSQSLASIAARQ